MTELPSQAAGNPLVDCHTHVFTADMPVADGAWIRPDYSFTGTDLIAAMDAHGVHFSVVSGLSISGYYNDYMIDELRANRRLRGTAMRAGRGGAGRTCLGDPIGYLNLKPIRRGEQGWR